MTRGFSIFPRGSAVYLRHDDCDRVNVHEYETISTYHSQETKRFVLLGSGPAEKGAGLLCRNVVTGISDNYLTLAPKAGFLDRQRETANVKGRGIIVCHDASETAPFRHRPRFRGLSMPALRVSHTGSRVALRFKERLFVES